MSNTKFQPLPNDISFLIDVFGYTEEEARELPEETKEWLLNNHKKEFAGWCKEVSK